MMIWPRPFGFFNLVSAFLNSSDYAWGYTTVDWFETPDRVAELMKFGWFDIQRYLGFNFDSIDVVSETDAHPGIKSHELFADRLFEWIVSRHGEKITGTQA